MFGENSNAARDYEARDYEARDLRDPYEMDELWNSHRRWRLFVISFAVVVLAGMGVLAWVGYPILDQNAYSLDRLRGIETSIGTMQDDIKKTQSQVADSAAQQEALRQSFEALNHETGARIEAAGKQASEAAAGMLSRLGAEVAALGMRVTGVESSQQRDQMRIASLQQELGQVRGELARQSDELAVTRRQVDGSTADSARQISDLQSDAQRERGNVDAISAKLATERFDFELSKGRARDVVPGISIEITATDVRYHRATGWMSLASEHRTIWLRNQSAQEPVVFYGPQDGQRRELILSRINKDSITGYLILPKGAGDAASAERPGAGEGRAVSASLR